MDDLHPRSAVAIEQERAVGPVNLEDGARPPHLAAHHPQRAQGLPEAERLPGQNRATREPILTFIQRPTGRAFVSVVTPATEISKSSGELATKSRRKVWMPPPVGSARSRG
jgi:hypothetical protein